MSTTPLHTLDALLPDAMAEKQGPSSRSAWSSCSSGGAELFTGNNLIIAAWASQRVSTGLLLRNWLIGYVAVSRQPSAISHQHSGGRA